MTQTKLKLNIYIYIFILNRGPKFYLKQQGGNNNKIDVGMFTSYKHSTVLYCNWVMKLNKISLNLFPRLNWVVGIVIQKYYCS